MQTALTPSALTPVLTQKNTGKNISHRKGFTLIEVLLVILIITTISVAGFSAIINVQQGAIAREIKTKIISMIDLARAYAMNGKALKDCNNQVPEQFSVEITQAQPTPTADNPQEIFFKATGDSCSSVALKTYIIETYTIDPRYIVDKAVTFSYTVPTGNFETSPHQTGKIEIPIRRIDAPASEKLNISPLQTVTLYENIGIPE